MGTTGARVSCSGGVLKAIEHLAYGHLTKLSAARSAVLEMQISMASASTLPPYLLLHTHNRSGRYGCCLFSTAKMKKEKNVGWRALLLHCQAQNLAEIAPAATVLYGTVLLGGGLFAFARSGSKGSAFGGLSGATLTAIAYYLMQSPETTPAGQAIGFGVAFLFSAVFGIRLAATQKLIPSGVLLAISLGAAAVFGSAYLQNKF
ncbi:hypothetical protein HPP92_014501 [Vanilla planifolia]|uniref:Uncharacterized protein n=1 Tax=Vanilla planifolia TaxID=51239 RepID=A0A835UR61_VANPL|nr:hypothetical protein HPP92_014501 [Vanilla planifolia]